MGRWQGQTDPAGRAGTGWASSHPRTPPLQTTVTLFLALRTAWGDGQRGQSSPVTARLSMGMRWSPQSPVTLQRAKGGQGAARSESSRDAGCGCRELRGPGEHWAGPASTPIAQLPPAPCTAPASVLDGIQSSISGVGPRGVQPWLCSAAG